jgi:transposase-like protein
MPKKHPRYSDEFRTEIVRKVVIDLQPVVQLAREHHIDPSTIRAWVRNYPISTTSMHLATQNYAVKCALCNEKTPAYK